MAFIEDNTNIENDLDLHLIGRYEGPTVVVLDEFSNYLCVMPGKNANSKWEMVWLQMKNQSKYPLKMTAALRNLKNIEDILRWTGTYPKSGGKITFYSNTATNEPMWHFFMIF